MKLIIIDDSESKAEVILKALGYYSVNLSEVRIFKSWEEVVKSRISLADYDRILLDHNLEGEVNGRQIFEILEEGVRAKVYGISNSPQMYLPEENRFNDLKSFSKLFLRLREDSSEGELRENTLR